MFHFFGGEVTYFRQDKQAPELWSVKFLRDSRHLMHVLQEEQPFVEIAFESSKTYTELFLLTESCLIKAVAYRDGFKPSGVSVINAVKAYHLPATDRALSVNGVNYRYHEGVFARTDMIEKSPVVSTGVLPEPSLDFVQAEDHYGIIFDGYIQVPEKGVWEFATCSDDGSVLLIDGEKVVDNDGGHAAITAIGRVALEAGFHSFRLLYFEDYEGQELAWSWRAPGAEDFSPVPADALYCR